MTNKDEEFNKKKKCTVHVNQMPVMLGQHSAEHTEGICC